MHAKGAQTNNNVPSPPESAKVTFLFQKLHLFFLLIYIHPLLS